MHFRRQPEIYLDRLSALFVQVLKKVILSSLQVYQDWQAAEARNFLVPLNRSALLNT